MKIRNKKIKAAQDEWIKKDKQLSLQRETRLLSVKSVTVVTTKTVVFKAELLKDRFCPRVFAAVDFVEKLASTKLYLAANTTFFVVL